MDRPMRAMDLELFKRMIDDAAILGVPELYPNGYGEILTLKNLEDYLTHISSKKHRFKVMINTNGYRLTDEKIASFIDHKIHMLNVTIDGATAETAQAVRVGLKTDVIEDNIRRLLAARKARGASYPLVRVGMVLIPQNAHEATPFVEKWTGKVDFVGFGGFSNRAGSLGGFGDASKWDQNHGARASCCVLPFRELDIWSDGKAVLCCEDWNEEHVVGDLRQQTLREIWHGPELARARRLHARGRGDGIPICAKCNLWRPVQPGMKLWSRPARGTALPRVKT